MKGFARSSRNDWSLEEVTHAHQILTPDRSLDLTWASLSKLLTNQTNCSRAVAIYLQNICRALRYGHLPLPLPYHLTPGTALSIIASPIAQVHKQVQRPVPYPVMGFACQSHRIGQVSSEWSWLTLLPCCLGLDTKMTCLSIQTHHKSWITLYPTKNNSFKPCCRLPKTSASMSEGYKPLLWKSVGQSTLIPGYVTTVSPSIEIILPR